MCKLEFYTPLLDIIIESLQKEIYPSQLKITKVYLKYKTGPTMDTSSYQHISLISTFSKIKKQIVR